MLNIEISGIKILIFNRIKFNIQTANEILSLYDFVGYESDYLFSFEFVVRNDELVFVGKLENVHQFEYIEDINLIMYHIENYLYHIFPIANLTYPGCISIWRPKIIVNDTNDHIPGYFKGEDWNDGFEYDTLMGDYFAFSKELNSEFENLNVIEMDLKNVCAWFSRLNIGSKQIAKSRIERALFSLLHISKMFQSDYTTIIWLTMALESLYDTSNSIIGKTLQNRIQLVHKFTETKKLKKKLRAFYDTRSRFVHGEINVNNSLANEVIDKSLDDHFRDINEQTSFGMYIVLLTIQFMIKKDLQELKFEESLCNL